jgi:hypothetical protein
MTSRDADRASSFSGTALRFKYDPRRTVASTRQISALMDGFGYDRTTCVHDDDAKVMMVAAVKHAMVRLADHDHEVTAIRKVVQQQVDVTYYRLRVTDEHIYEPDEFEVFE